VRRSGATSKNPGQPVPKCDTFNVDAVLGRQTALDFNAARNAAYAKRVLVYRGFSGQIGYKKYTFYDPNTLAKGELDRTPWRAGGFWGWIGGDQSSSITLEYAREVTFEQADKKTACLAGVGTVLSCISGPLGRAARVTKDLLSVEVRRGFGKAELGMVRPSVGFAPKVVYDANNNDWAVALPVYLFGDKSGLTGGVRADWESKEHDVVVGVFLTKTFSISDGL
jgi:hypothetical protein